MVVADKASPGSSRPPEAAADMLQQMQSGDLSGGNWHLLEVLIK
jgi:hypothetical protein